MTVVVTGRHGRIGERGEEVGNAHLKLGEKEGLGVNGDKLQRNS